LFGLNEDHPQDLYMRSDQVLVVIPAFNEEKSVANVIMRLRQIVPEFDRVVVNDGSHDATGDIVANLGEKQLKLPCNLGYGQALQTGLKYALIRGYDVVVSMDADGQHRPEDAPRLVESLRQSQADIVIGSRFYEGGVYDTPFERRAGQLLFSYLTKFLIGQRIYDTTSGFKVLNAAACKMMVDGIFMDFHTETIVRASLLGLNIIEVPVTVEERAFGRSMHSLTSIFQYPLQTLLLTIVTILDVLILRRAQR